MRKLQLTILLAAVALLAGCMGAVRQQKLNVGQIKHPETEQIVGLTTVKGEDVRFDPPGAGYANNTVRGWVAGAAYSAHMEDIGRLWVMRRSVSAGRTVALVSVLGGAAAVAVVAVRSRSQSAPPPPPPLPTSTYPPGYYTLCPFVYSWDGAEYIFDAEIFGASLTRGMEMDDYSALEHIKERNGEYRLRLANEIDESESTDVLELRTVDHPQGTRVATDERGNLYTLAHPTPPLSARDESGADLLPWLEATDRRIWEPPPAADPEGSVRHEIVMSFPKPAGAATAKLVSNVSTGEWAQQMVKALFELYGNQIGQRLASLDSDPKQAKELLDWTEREDVYRLRVWVEEPGGWHVRGAIPWSAQRVIEERVVPLDISRATGDTLRIRVEPPAGFWALNSFAVDYSAEQPTAVTGVALKSARKLSGEDVSGQLHAADAAYYTAEIGDRAEVVFAAPPVRPGMLRSVFLHSRGYYRPYLRTTGQPDTETLRQVFELPDAFARLAAKRWAAFHSERVRTN